MLRVHSNIKRAARMLLQASPPAATVRDDVLASFLMAVGSHGTLLLPLGYNESK